MADGRRIRIGGRKRGVLVAARIDPTEERALRTFEPLFPIPKSAIITRYSFVGRSEQLAVANLHGINFSSGLGRFREQLDDIAKELMNHDGPISSTVTSTHGAHGGMRCWPTSRTGSA